MFKNRRKDKRDPPRSLNRGETERGICTGECRRGCRPDKSGLSGHPAFFRASGHLLPPFRASFFGGGNGPAVHSRQDVVSGNFATERKGEREDEREEEAGREGRGIGGGRKGGGMGEIVRRD